MTQLRNPYPWQCSCPTCACNTPVDPTVRLGLCPGCEDWFWIRKDGHVRRHDQCRTELGFQIDNIRPLTVRAICPACREHQHARFLVA